MANCRSCEAPMVWAKTEDRDGKPGRVIPLDSDDGREAAIVADGNLVIIGETDGGQGRLVPQVRYVKKGEGKHTTHFATCPNAAAHRKGR